MSIKKRFVLSVSVLVAMVVALVTGIVCLAKDTNSKVPSVPVENNSVENPTTYTYQPGQIVLAGTNQSAIDYKYEPVSNQGEISPKAKAYEYIFGRPDGVDEVMAVTLKPLSTSDDVNISYTYSLNEPLTFEEITETDLKFEAQTIDIKGDDIYIYIIVSPKDENASVSFNTAVRWNFGNAGTLTYNVNGETITETIVKGQQLPEPEAPTAPEGYYFDTWYKDANFTKPVTFPYEVQVKQLYARFHNFPSSSEYMSYSDGGYTIISNPGSENLIIPSIYDDGINGVAPVVAIGDRAFESSSITSISLPESITKIGNNAFYYCSSLTNINLSGCVSLVTIGDYAFWECYYLTNIDLSGCVSLTTIGDYAFMHTNLTSVDFSDCVRLTTTGSGILYGCENLTSVTLPSSLTSIGDAAFSGSTNLRCVNLSDPTRLQVIDEGAFYGCISLSDINLEECTNLIDIGSSAFYICENLKSVDLSGCESLTTISADAFKGCTSLESVKLPSGLQMICQYAFYGCELLKDINLQNCTSLAEIQYWAFYNCYSLTNVVLPNSVISLDDGVFANCKGLISVTLPYNLTSIEKFVFNCCENLTSIIIPDSVTSIGESAFHYCSSLTNINLSSCVNLTTIGECAFGYCRLDSIDFSGCASLTTIGDNAFIRTNLTSVDFSDCIRLTTTGSGILYGCENLTSVTLPSSLTSIGDAAFSGSSNLRCVNLSDPTRLQVIDEGAFYGCISLSDINLEECTNLINIGSRAFYNCENLKSVDLSGCESLTTISADAFRGCTSLESVKLPSGLQMICKDAFKDCTALQVVGFGDISTWYVVDNADDWNSCNIANATEVAGLTASASNENATALKNNATKYWFRVD